MDEEDGIKGMSPTVESASGVIATSHPPGANVNSAVASMLSGWTFKSSNVTINIVQGGGSSTIPVVSCPQIAEEVCTKPKKNPRNSKDS
jgi:hypothetical protein